MEANPRRPFLDQLLPEEEKGQPRAPRWQSDRPAPQRTEPSSSTMIPPSFFCRGAQWCGRTLELRICHLLSVTHMISSVNPGSGILAICKRGLSKPSSAPDPERTGIGPGACGVAAVVVERFLLCSPKRHRRSIRGRKPTEIEKEPNLFAGSSCPAPPTS